MSAATRARNVPRVAALTESVRVTDGSRPRAVMTYHPHNLPIKRTIMDKWQVLQVFIQVTPTWGIDNNKCMIYIEGHINNTYKGIGNTCNNGYTMD